MKEKDLERLARQYIIEKGKKANPRVQQVLYRLTLDLFRAIEDLDLTEDEIWTAVDFMEEAGKKGEIKLITAGLGLDRFMDIRLEQAEASYGIGGGTPRSIEGPLYVHGAPKSVGYARLDDEDGPEGDVFFMQGTVRDVNGELLPGAEVEVWHADTKGNYSFFDETQPEYNLRRTIITDENGRYQFRSILPSGYGVEPDGCAQRLLDQLGRHGQRPPHIHFFVHADGHRKLTTQINLEGSKYTYDDYAFADRLCLVPKMTRIDDPRLIEEKELKAPYYSIDYHFRLHPDVPGAPPTEVERRRAKDFTDKEDQL